MPIISIIVPVYRVEAYLPRCIESILGQSFPDFELILVDDGSPDRCGEICEEYAARDSRIRVIHKENGGLSDARNAGIREAKGDCLGFVDSDDYLHPEMVERLYRALTENGADLAICGYTYVDENGRDLHMPSPVRDEVMTASEALGKLYAERSWYYITAWNKLYRRSIFNEIRFPVGKNHEDEGSIHRIFYCAEKIVSIKDELYYYVQRSDSIVHTRNIRSFDIVDMLYDRLCFYREINLETEPVYRQLLGLYTQYRTEIRAKTKEERRRIKEVDRLVYQIYRRFGTKKPLKKTLLYRFPDLIVLYHKLLKLKKNKS